MKVFKFILPTDRVTLTVKLFHIRKVLRFDLQNDVPVVWCVVDPYYEREYLIECVYTGDEDKYFFVDFAGTIKLREDFILHYFIAPL